MARVLIAANSSWNLKNFRGGLIAALVHAGHEVTTVSPDENGIVIEERRIPHRSWTIDRSSAGIFDNLRSVCEMLLLIYRERPDVFFGFTIKPNIYGCFACRMVGVPAVPNVSGLGTAFLGTSALSKAVLHMYRLAFRNARKVFFQNPDDEELFVRERVVRRGQSEILPGSGVNLKRFLPSEVPNRVRFLMIARLLGDKGVHEYVDAARRLRVSMPNVSCALLGELDHENRTAISEAEIKQWTREGVLQYLGSCSDVRPFIRESTAVVLPSYREGLPRALLEAAAMGRPLIGTDVPGCRELVRDGITGFLCQPRDADSLASAMRRLANSPRSEWIKMGAAARAMAETEFDEALVFQAYLDLINRVG